MTVTPIRPAASAPWLDAVVQRGTRIRPWVGALAIAALLVGCWSVVYVSGGTQAAMPHLFYVPIILATLPFGLPGSLATAVAAGVMCGPLMPLDVTTGERQELTSWLIRGGMFLVVGGVASLSLRLRERAYEQQLSSELRDTMTASPAPATDESLVPLVADMIATRRFHTVFQPMYSLLTGRLVAVEALTRFDVEPYRSPDRWFAAADAAGRGVELEVAALAMALETAADLDPTIELSINASPCALDDTRLIELLTVHQGRQLVVEITEHAVVEDYHLLEKMVANLRTLGVKIAVDDAGAGFASLRHIVHLEPDIIKLDISLTQDLAASPLRRALAGSLIDFAHSTGAQLVVEGIEEVADLNAWTALGAHAAQGFLVGRPGPLPAPSVSPLITTLQHSRRG